MIKIKYIIILLTLIVSQAALAKLVSSVDKTQINNSEQIVLRIKTDNTNALNNLNLKLLERDFIIINTQKTQSISIFNGNRSINIENILLLEPKRVGQLYIPEFSYNKDKTKKIAITVKDIAKNDFSNNIIFITAQVNNNKPKTQEQVIYSINFYSKVSVANIIIPFKITANDAIVKKLTDNNTLRQVDYNGKKLWYKKLNYAIYPQRSGTITIARIKESVDLRGGGFNKKLILFAKAIELDVQKPDINYPIAKHWLPAKSVKLTSKFITNPAIFKVGEVVVREIIMTVSGQTKEQLPDIYIENNNLFEQYPEDKALSEQIAAYNIISTIKQKVIVIPNKAGKHILPEINITWFDVNDNKVKLATLPAYEVSVLASNIANKDIKNKPIQQEVNNSIIAELPKVIKHKDKQTIINPTNNNYLFSTLGFAILWLLTLLWCYFKKTKKIVNKDIKPANNIKKYLKDIKKYSKQNNAKETKNALNLWLAASHLDYISINEFIIAITNTTIRDELANKFLSLNQSLHQENSNNHWQGIKFWLAFKNALDLLKKNKPTKNKIPSLYPQSLTSES